MMQNDEDMPSDNEQEIHDELNPEMDGHIKISKDVRGYDAPNIQAQDSQDESEINIQEVNEDEDGDSVSQQGVKQAKNSKSRKRVESGVSDLEKYTKPLREAH